VEADRAGRVEVTVVPTHGRRAGEERDVPVRRLRTAESPLPAHARPAEAAPHAAEARRDAGEDAAVRGVDGRESLLRDRVGGSWLPSRTSAPPLSPLEAKARTKESSWSRWAHVVSSPPLGLADGRVRAEAGGHGRVDDARRVGEELAVVAVGRPVSATLGGTVTREDVGVGEEVLLGDEGAGLLGLVELEVVAPS
jgi:hypothetical protein